MNPLEPRNATTPPFANLDPEGGTAAAEALSRAPGRAPGFYVVLAPLSAPPSAELVEAFGALLDLDRYSARQRLLLPAPQFLRRHEQAAAAEAEATHLRGMGLPAVVVGDFDFQQVNLFEAVMLRAEGSRFIAEAVGGAEFSFRARDVCSICKGVLTVREVHETTRGSAFGTSQPAVSDVRRTDITPAFDVHLASEPTIVRFHGAHFDFRRLYPDRAVAVSPMMVALLEWLRSAAPTAPVFDNFDSARGHYGQATQTLAVNTTFERVLTRPTLVSGMTTARTRVLLEDDASAFNLYSTLSRICRLRQTAASDAGDRD